MKHIRQFEHTENGKTFVLIVRAYRPPLSGEFYIDENNQIKRATEGIQESRLILVEADSGAKS